MVRSIPVVCIGVLLVLGGCGGDSESESEAGNNIYAQLSVIGEEDKVTTAFASFRRGGETGLLEVLAEGDILEVDNGRVSKTMEPYNAFSDFFDGFFGIFQSFLINEVLGAGELIDQLTDDAANGGVYSSTFYTLSDIYTISLSQVDGVEALDNTVNLPVGFAIEAPSVDEQFTYDSEVTFVWSNDEAFDPDEKIKISIYIDCQYEVDIFEGFLFPSAILEVEDNEVHTMTILEMMGADTDQSVDCKLKAEFVRRAEGELDENFGAGGTIIAQQIRSIEFEVISN